MRIAALPFAALAFTLAAPAFAGGPYVVVHDDGTIQNQTVKTGTDVGIIQDKLLALYGETGAPMPEVLSVWTTFPMGGNPVNTYFDPQSNDVKGIGLESAYGGDGTFDMGIAPPLRSILFHNDVTQIAKRAALVQAPEDGYAQYLFLLELSHNWGPAMRVPGATPDELVGFDFHWSFWMDAGGSPAGGNLWKDNGDGTFTTLAQAPGTVKYSKLDLYMMGLADESEVPPLGVLENAVVPTNAKDPLWGGAIAAHSFPWFAPSPLTVTATRRALTIADLIGATGTRDPASSAAQKSWSLGIVLVVGSTADDAAVAAAQAIFDPIASSFAPAFAAATSGRGSMDVVTGEPDAGAPDAGAEAEAGPEPTEDAGGGEAAPAEEGSDKGCGCRVGASDGRATWSAGALAALVAAASFGRRRRARRAR